LVATRQTAALAQFYLMANRPKVAPFSRFKPTVMT
jgi:hypothetical protein